MKKNNFFKFSKVVFAMVMAIALIGTSCKKDEETTDPGGGEDPIVLDGVYIKGAGTALTDFDTKGKMAIAKNEVVQEERASLFEMYVAVSAGTDGFNIYTVDGGVQTSWGPGGDFAMVAEADLDAEEPRDGLWRGSLVETETPFVVPEDGLYHVAFDSEAGIVVIARVKWGLIGGATPGGWGENTVLEASAFDLNTMTFSLPSVTVFEDAWKFRYSNGWKIILDPEFDFGGADKGIKVNCNFGGAVDALSAGGADIVNDTYANYAFDLTWTLGEGYSASVVFESEAEPLAEYPEGYVFSW